MESDSDVTGLAAELVELDGRELAMIDGRRPLFSGPGRPGLSAKARRIYAAMFCVNDVGLAAHWSRREGCVEMQNIV